MSHVYREPFVPVHLNYTPAQIEEIMKQPRWKTVDVRISPNDLENNFSFLNDAVVLRPNREGVPLMTTTSILGPILPGESVSLDYYQGNGVVPILPPLQPPSLIDQLENLYYNANEPSENSKAASMVYAKWLSAKDGGKIPNLGSKANVFGSTGSLFINQAQVDFPVLDPITEPLLYADTLAFYGARLLAPGEPFDMGFSLPLWGMEYSQVLPDYIRSYAMEPFGGGGLFVEHHPFPHIFMPKPDQGNEVFCVSKITLGRESIQSTDEKPVYRFTTFRIPSDGSALAIRPETIHNDSYTRGPQVVFLANTPADTVALRSTAPFTEINLENVEPDI